MSFDQIWSVLYQSNVYQLFLFLSFGQTSSTCSKLGASLSPYSRTFLVFEKTPLSPQILKCNHSGGSAVLRDLTSESTLHDLQLSVQNSTQIDMASQKCNYTLLILSFSLHVFEISTTNCSICISIVLISCSGH